MSTTDRQRGSGRAPTPRPQPVVATLRSRVGNRAVAKALAPTGSGGPVQRTLTTDVRSAMEGGLDQAEADMLLLFMYTASHDELVRACRSITAAQWREIEALVPGGLDPSEGAAHIQWARTRNADVLTMLGEIPSTSVASFTEWLGRSGRRRFAAAVRHGHVDDEKKRTAMNSVFGAVPDAEFSTLLRVFAARFRVRPRGGGDAPRRFDANGVRRLFNVFLSLPEGAVADNPSFSRMERERGADGSGYYEDDTGAVVISYRSLTERWDTVDASAGSASSNLSMGVNNALTGQNVFDSVVRHEVGHAVDNRLGLNGTYCVGAGKTRGGAWVRQQTNGVAEAVVSASGGFIDGLDAAPRRAVVRALQRCVNSRRPDQIASRVRSALRVLPRAERAAAVTSALADQAVAALQICFSDDKTPGAPWYRPQDDGGVALGGRIYQEAYAGEWWSYASSARARKVSQYQFRSPYEWIAEAYNAYYAPPTRGTLLSGSDSTTKTWFDTNVHTATAGQPAGREKAPPDAASGPGFS